MKEFSLLIWLTQLGLSIATPLAGSIFLGVWLHNRLGLGMWTVWCGIILGLCSAVSCLRSTMHVMNQMVTDKTSDHSPRLHSMITHFPKEETDG